jgi:hypothetical protein
MGGASPQKLHASLTPGARKIANVCCPESAGTNTTRKSETALWEGGRAEVLDTCLAHWPQSLEDSSSSWDSKGFSSLHPVLFRKFRANAAERLFFPAEGIIPGLAGPFCPGAGKKVGQVRSGRSAVQEESGTTKFYPKGVKFTRQLL